MYKTLPADSQEAKVIGELKDITGQLHKMFEDMLVDTAKNKRALGQIKNTVDSGVKMSKKGYWYLDLTPNEWDLLNGRLDIEIGKSTNYLDSITKWLYNDKNGTRVFAIYGIGDGTEATVLYAVGGKKAIKEYQYFIDFMEGNNYESKQQIDRGRQNFYRRLEIIFATRQTSSGFNLDVVARGKSKGTASSVYVGKQRSDTGGDNSGSSTDSRTGIKNSIRDIDNYTEKQYNDYGWVRANDVLTASEYYQWDRNWSDKEFLGNRFTKNVEGETIIPVGKRADKLVYAKGTAQHPIITKVVTIKNENEISLVRRDILDFEKEGYYDACEIVKSYFGEETFDTVKSRDYASYSEFEERFVDGESGGDVNTDSGEGTNGRAGSETNRGDSGKPEITELFSRRDVSNRELLEKTEESDIDISTERGRITLSRFNEYKEKKKDYDKLCMEYVNTDRDLKNLVFNDGIIKKNKSL